MGDDLKADPARDAALANEAWRRALESPLPAVGRPSDAKPWARQSEDAAVVVASAPVALCASAFSNPSLAPARSPSATPPHRASVAGVLAEQHVELADSFARAHAGTREELEHPIADYLAYTKDAPHLHAQYERAVAAAPQLLAQHEALEQEQRIAALRFEIGRMQVDKQESWLQVQPPAFAREAMMLNELVAPIAEVADLALSFAPIGGQLLAACSAATGRRLCGIGMPMSDEERVISGALAAAPFAGKLLNAGAKGAVAVSRLAVRLGRGPDEVIAFLKAVSALDHDRPLLLEAVRIARTEGRLTAAHEAALARLDGTMRDLKGILGETLPRGTDVVAQQTWTEIRSGERPYSGNASAAEFRERFAEGQRFDPASRRWYKAEGEASRATVRLGARATVDEAVATLTSGTAEGCKSFQPFFAAARDAGLTTHEELAALVQRNGFASRPVDAISRDLKAVLGPRMVARMTLATESEVTAAMERYPALPWASDRAAAVVEARHRTLLDMTRGLNGGDKGTLAEAWYATVSGLPDGASQVRLLKAEMRAQGFAFEGDRKVDNVAAGVLHEVKGIDGPMTERDLAQFHDFVKIAQSQGGVTLTIDGKVQTLQRVQYTFLDPKAVKANAGWMRSALRDAVGPARKNLAFEIFNTRGETKIVTCDTVAELDETTLDGWLLKGERK